MKPKIAKEVKEEILAKVKAGEAIKPLAEKYGVSDRTIYAWIKGGVVNNVSWLDYAKLKKENQALKEIIGILTLEVEKSKKRLLSAR